MDTNQFIKKAQQVHNNKYDYSKVNYINSRTKITITCPEHGEFNQTPANHLFGHGCRSCFFKYTIKSNTQEFIEKAKQVHGNKYDYSKVDYNNAHSLITVICPEHGEFVQKSNNHLQGQGCRSCGIKNNSIKQASNTQEFIEKAKQVHGNKYDYSKVVYIKSKIKVIIICCMHGEFNQTPNSHLRGNGCFKCMYDNNKLLFKLDIKKFIEKAKAVHGNKYDYSKVDYITSKIKITITCPEHGEFNQTPNSHLKGVGCPICKYSKGELVLKEIFKKHNIIVESQYKIPEIIQNFRYDFYLPDYNLLIEFHGIQHYKYIPFFHHNGEDDLLKQKNRDDLVRYNARHYGYQYLEFNYKQLKHMTKEQFEEMVVFCIDKRS